jgi:DMSO/TMAO reductase YedYZ molybdopterin-dependent catalytic subunit
VIAAVVRQADPLNAEVPLGRLADHFLTPNEGFYARNHFAVPTIDPDQWRLRVGGLVETPLELSLRELHVMPAQTLIVTLECAGNGRSFFDPPIDGEQWGLGAVSTAEWKGVPLLDVLERAGVKARSSDLVFRGGDGAFERSLRLEEARRASLLLAYEMNGEPVPRLHGGPLRLIVPGWYAVASVKWLTTIEVVDRPFAGFFQTERYVYGPSDPVTVVRVRSVISQPEDRAVVASGALLVKGMAWSGSGPVSRVEVSVDGGDWLPANLSAPQRYAWRYWERRVRIPRVGSVTIRSRATDAAGVTQPDSAGWNRLGYGNNSIQIVTVRST